MQKIGKGVGEMNKDDSIDFWYKLSLQRYLLFQ